MSLFSRVSKEEQLAFLNDVLPQAMDQGIMLTAEDIEELYDNQYFPQKAQEEWEEDHKNEWKPKKRYDSVSNGSPVKQVEHYKELPGLHLYDEGDELDRDDKKQEENNRQSFYIPFRSYPELNSNEHIDRASPIDFVDRDLNVNEKVDPDYQWLPRYEHLSKEELLAAVEDFTKLYETFVPHVYRVKDKDGKETGPYLIGYGTQYYTDDDGNRRKVGEHDPDITEARARELLKREYERLYDSAIRNWANFDDFDNAIRMQALEAGYNPGTYHWTSDKSPNWRKMMDEYQMNHRWEDENYDINEVLQHGNWSVHDNPSSWLGVRANLRNYPYKIMTDDLEKRWSPMTENDRIEYIKEIQGR